MRRQSSRRQELSQVREERKTPAWANFEGFARSNWIDWEEVIPDAWRSATEAVLSQGALLIWGMTGDGGAVKLGIWDGEFRKWWYPSGADELNRLLRQIAAAFVPDGDESVAAK